jgi:hypothetical protein
MNRDPAEESFGQLQFVLELARDLLKNFDGFTSYFSPDTVTGQNKNVQLHYANISFD